MQLSSLLSRIDPVNQYFVGKLGLAAHTTRYINLANRFTINL